jgi:integrase
MAGRWDGTALALRSLQKPVLEPAKNERQIAMSEEKKRARGQGRIYERKGSAFLWCAYYLRGKQYRESTGTADPKKAEKYLDRKIREVGADLIGAKRFVGPQQERIKVSCGRTDWNEPTREACGCLCCSLYEYYRSNRTNSPQFEAHLKHICKHFEGWRALELDTEHVETFKREREERGAAPATINRSTQLLKQAYKLAVERKKLSFIPVITRLPESGNVRKGFFSEAEFRAVARHLPEYLKDFATFAYHSGMRRGEIASLLWEDVDGDVIRLRAENAKNGIARSVPIEGELSEVIERRRIARQVKKEDAPVKVSAWIFHHDGNPIVDIRKSWATACCMAGCGKLVCPKCNGNVDADYKCAKCSAEWTRDDLKYIGKLFHDLRRTAVRDMVRAGVPETVAMSISGHRTRSVFDRYNITDERDQREALKATQSYRASQRNKVATMPGGVN